MNKTTLKYSESFKLQILSELESGKFKSICSARRHYDIKGGATISAWIKKYGKTHLLNKVVRVETVKDRDQMKVLKDEIKELKNALVDAHLDLRLEHAWLELACESGGIEDIAEFKKKANITPSTRYQK